MTVDDKWNLFLKNGSPLAYLSYAAAKQNPSKGVKNNESSNAGANNKGKQCRGK